MKQIKPEVREYVLLDRNGVACPIPYQKGMLRTSSLHLVEIGHKSLLQSNGKPKYRPVYK